MITVYRIEHKKTKRKNGIGFGCYIVREIEIKGDWHNRMSNDHNNNETHPGMRDDLPNFYNINDDRDFYCAFKSIDDLKRWFRGYLTDIKKNGFVIKKYLVSEITESYSGLQTFFNVNHVIASEIYIK